MRTDVFTETLSGIMQIRFRLYNYVTMLQRYGPSVRDRHRLRVRPAGDRRPALLY